MIDYIEKLEKNLFNIVKDLYKPNILELGVENSRSTKKFLDICNSKNSYLYSFDINDCNNVANDKRCFFLNPLI